MRNLDGNCVLYILRRLQTQHKTLKRACELLMDIKREILHNIVYNLYNVYYCSTGDDDLP